MTVYLDAMGGDNAPAEIIKGAVMAVSEYDTSITLIGDEKAIKKCFEDLSLSSRNIEIINAQETIDMCEEPVKAVRAKKNSSMVVGASMLKEDKNSVFISAGSTGALLAAALLYTGRIKGIQRPALCTLLPGIKPCLFLDNGANADCKSDYLTQFAKMGSIYMEAVMNVKNPKVGLLNIGSEELKGNAFAKEAHAVLKDAEGINFVGNAEPKDLLAGVYDVVVTDGFSGNLVLKTIEATLGYTLSTVKGILKSGLKNNIAGAMIKKDLKAKLKTMDPASHGGAPFLGINGGVFKTHGNSDANAVKNAVGLALSFQRENVLDKMTKVLW